VTRQERHWAVAPSLGIALVVACSAESGLSLTAAEPEPAPTFIDVQIALHASGCSEGGCHSPPEGQAGLELVDAPWENLVGVPVTTCGVEDQRRRVVPGQPTRSYLMNKLRGRELCGGSRMPLGCDDTAARPCMRPERIDLIERWIAAGAER
jgi:hypothetical protein